MPARRNPKKSRTPQATPLGIDPAAGHGPLPTLPVESALPVEVGAAGTPTPDVPVVVDVPAVLDAPPALDVPAVLEAPAVPDVSPVDPSPAAKAVAPKAGPPQTGGARSAGGKSQRAGQPRRYAFRRS
ncbi:hypothetical protein F8271_08245 [Micromonospora sp. ALFpr18c]|uniref:hypothetical protein n=1 Tax=unclassified Micromonospora TaxID=2617518 RepID=UPI00124B358A|nr:hypothetical protein [Micromonospora sp. ALFpr18c]KAB1945394.1 hypothetical protein F8271_08245 [Micromonospora sp. ALFpr18c]